MQSCLGIVNDYALLGWCGLYVDSWFNLCDTISEKSKDLNCYFKFYADSKVSDLMDSLKTFHQAKTADVDKVLLGWFMQYLDEKFPPICCEPNISVS